MSLSLVVDAQVLESVEVQRAQVVAAVSSDDAARPQLEKILGHPAGELVN